MDGVGVYEAKTKFPELLRRVERGETVTITRHGHPVAKLTPCDEKPRRDTEELLAQMRHLRKGNKLKGMTIKELIEAGRKY